MIINRKYPAKILLFGEYTVLEGGSAFAIPTSRFDGYWSFNNENGFDLAPFLDYLKALQKEGRLEWSLDIAKFEDAIKNGLSFQSNIPVGYGLGSSGALSAAVYDTFAEEKDDDLQKLKSIFAQLESFFHGSSSGIDPLICYVKQAVHINSDGIVVEPIPIWSKGDHQLFLFDSKKSRKTDVLVNWFVDQCKQTVYRNRIHAELLPLVEESIAAIRYNEHQLLFEIFHQISHFQFRYFQPMIPEVIKEVWLDSLNSDWFKIKLCGAGGGGFFLGMTKDIALLKKQYPDNVIDLVTPSA